MSHVGKVMPTIRHILNKPVFLVGLALSLVLIAGLAIASTIRAGTTTIQGRVVAADGPAAGAVVRVATSDYYTVADAEGRFSIGVIEPLLQPDALLDVTAWIPGHLIGWAEAAPGETDVVIELTAHLTGDNPDYDWFSHEGDPGSLSCSHCMPCYDEWQADAHAIGATNPRFLSLYNGTDLAGTPGAPTTYAYDPALGLEIPTAPSQGQDEVGPGFRLDYPELGGNCATCHVPGAAARPGGAYHVAINTVEGIDQEGVFCEFCHKVGDVYLQPSTGLPDPSLPGVLSMRLYRPEEGEQVFFANLDDVPQGRRVTYLPLFQESRFCAPCHFGAFWGTVAYNSFGEWLESPYSDPETGQTCQNCHMPTVDYEYFVFPEMGGNARNPARMVSHRMLGAADAEFLATTVVLTVDAVQAEGQLQVTVRVTNSGAGHHVPTDNPLRNMILLVSAADADGQPLPLVDGPTIPAWGGVGDPAEGYYAGLPGVLYAKVMADFFTGETPSYTYWRLSEIVSDNRLPALATDETVYTFALPEDGATNVGPFTVEAELLLRRAFIELMALKGWDMPDMRMARETVVVP